MILLLDNIDSFSYMLGDYLAQCGEVNIVKNQGQSFKEIISTSYNGFVISPGPKRPEDHPLIFELIEYYEHKIPILGVCLGFQALGIYYGYDLVHSIAPFHGKKDEVFHNGSGLFAGISNPMVVGRYHSLSLKKKEDENPILLNNNEFDFILDSFNNEGIAMSGRHKNLPIYGVQFHPESVLSPQGLLLIKNWMALVSSK